MSIFNFLASSSIIPNRLRTVLCILVGMRVSLRTQICSGVYFRTNKVAIGERSSVNVGCVFDNRAPVEIGKNVGIGIGVTFITSDHDFSNPDCRAGKGSLKPIRVEDGAWLGSSVTVLGGVTIGHGAVVAAGSLVRTDCQPDTLYGGVPARVIRRLNERAV